MHNCNCHDHDCEHEEMSKYDMMFNEYNLHLHDEIEQEEANKVIASNKDKNNTLDVKKFLLSCMEITSLKVTDNEDSILKLTEQVNQFSNDYPELPHLASIVVYPRFVSLVSKSLEVEGTELACVTGGFPSSQTFTEIKTIETSLAIKDGATEIDMVLPVGFFLAGDYEQIYDEIRELRDICGEDIKLKVILETGALQTSVNIKKAALLSLYSGADFIKTSTGKIEPGAKPYAVLVMCKAIKEFYQKTGNKVGIKIAGGVRTVEDAIGYYSIVKEMLGKEWLTPEFFRIGASGLVPNLLQELTGFKIFQ